MKLPFRKVVSLKSEGHSLMILVRFSLVDINHSEIIETEVFCTQLQQKEQRPWLLSNVSKEERRLPKVSLFLASQMEKVYFLKERIHLVKRPGQPSLHVLFNLPGHYPTALSRQTVRAELSRLTRVE